MTGAQLRAARALLGWTAQQLADASAVSLATIRRAEIDGGAVRMIAANAAAIVRALDAAGVEFIDPNGSGPGVRLKHPTAPQ
ncbi:MAG: transcriptional regulator [Rhodospirillales bacterium]